MEVTLPHSLSETKSRLLAWASTFPYCAFLENCDQTVDQYGQFELILGVGKKDAQTFTTWDQLQLQTDCWLMGIFPYELKHKFEARASSHLAPLVDFPEVALFVPQVVILIRRGGKSAYIVGEEEWGIEGITHPIATAPASNESPEFRALTDRPTYISTVNRIKEQIKDGDFYEMNLAQAYVADHHLPDPAWIYQQLTEISPVPFASFIRYDHQYLICASPERFLKHYNRQLVSQPIKGTAPRGDDQESDEKYKQELRNSIKEQAENVMIVDLTRNDLYRSSIPHTVEVPSLFEIQSFPQVHQMVSTITGMKLPDLSWQQVIEQTFPPGSMTGAPKVKVMEAIDQYEPCARGIYAGSVGYISPKGDFDLNVIIRSLVYDDMAKQLCYHVGGAITYDSDPIREYEETLVKAKAIQLLFKK